MSPQPAVYLLETVPAGFGKRVPEAGRDNGPDSADRLEWLARGLVRSPAWRDMSRAVLVLRRGPVPALAAVGYFSAAQKARIEGLGSQLAGQLPHLRYVSYKQAEVDCEALAERLIGRFGRQEIGRFCYRAIPRGGLIVLGMLAYVLDLGAGQLDRSPPPDVPLVIVDDCALSGLRFSEQLRRCDSRHVIFAHLYSAPELRTAIEAGEPRVLASIGARDLSDHAGSIHGSAYEEWRDRWRRRPNPGYWTGHPDSVCFAWNEPDYVFWNSVTERSEVSWRLLPPESCLKNRQPGGDDLRLQHQPAGKGPLKPSSRVLFGELEGRIVVADLDGGECFELDGVAADMWRALVESDSIGAAEERVAREYRIDRNALHADMCDFIADLRRRNLLEERGVRIPANETAK